MKDGFYDLDEELIVVRSQGAIAVYHNQAGGVTIRGERAWDEEDDTYIVITTAAAALAVADAIYREIEANQPDEEADRKDPTAAERQRRRRDRKREQPSASADGETGSPNVTGPVTHKQRDIQRDERDGRADVTAGRRDFDLATGISGTDLLAALGTKGRTDG